MAKEFTKDQYTLNESWLNTSDGHEIYVHDWGHADAETPIIFLHGGPGGNVDNGHKNYFDPTKQRVVFFDQRGSGQSRPQGSLENNTTADLIEDINRIAEARKIGEFALTGGSWGSCLALAYALENPERVKAMLLRGLFTGSQAEIDWLDQGTASAFFPDVWQAYLDATPAEHLDNPTAYHFKTALGDGPQAKRSAYAYDNLEGALLSLDDRFSPDDYDKYDPSSIRIEMHYMQNRCFLPDNHILDNVYRLNMPVWLVHGRYDMVCPPKTAYELSQRLPDGRLVWTIAGHSGSDRANFDAIRALSMQLTES